MNEDMLTFALDYAKRGFAVFPLKQDKTPYISNGFQKATTDEMQIETWWKRWPQANIGIATGQMSGGLCVIDLDVDEEKGKNGLKAMRDWEQKYGSVMKPSCMAITGRGGLHYFFKTTEHVKCRINLLPGVDIRGDGGYIMAPPSLHPNGTRYKWRDNYSIDEVPVIEMDDNIKYLLYHDSTTMQSKPAYISPDKIPDGERNGTIFKFACMMQARGASDSAVYAATMAENEAKCCPPLTEHEIQIIVNSALKYEKGKPIYVQADGSAIQGQREPIFALDKNGFIKNTWDNTREAIEFNSQLYGHIKFNELQQAIFVYGSLPWEQAENYRPWKNSDDASLKTFLEKEYGLSSTEKIMDALLIVAEKNKFNPIVDELKLIHNEYKDCCKGSIRRLLPEYMGADDNEYHFQVMKVYMLGAICRVFYPGCKFDYSIVLYGAQGFGKSEFLRRLAICSEWFNDNFNTFDGDKAIEKLQGMWIVEMAELKALKSAKDSESFKSFLTSRVDTYRAPYSRRSEQRPRMCVFAGTTNNKNVFVDKTGNRRFLPIEARKGKETKSLFGNADEVTEDFRKAWAEAMQLFYDANMQPELILPSEAQAVAENMQEEFSEEDYRVGVIQNWLNSTECTKVCVPQLIEYALEEDLQKTSKVERREIMDILDNEIAGWSRAKTKDKGRMTFAKYGNQIAFLKDCTE